MRLGNAQMLPFWMAEPSKDWQLLMCCTKNWTGSPHHPFLDLGQQECKSQRRQWVGPVGQRKRSRIVIDSWRWKYTTKTYYYYDYIVIYIYIYIIKKYQIIKNNQTYPPGQRPRKTWSFNFDDKDLLSLDKDLLLLGLCGWKSVFNQVRSVFWLVPVRILMVLSCIMKSFLIIYDISWSYMTALHAGKFPQ